MTTEYKRMRQLISTSAEWAANDIVIGDGELAIETISGGGVRMKVGDGARKYSELPYFPAGGGTAVSKAEAAAIGIAPDASDMGTYTGDILTDDQTAKQNIQELETAIEANDTFTQSGAGAVGRTNQEKLREWVTPQDFGAVADATDHTEAFEALAEQYNLGRAIRIPDLGYPYLVDPDTIILTPPATYNNDYRRPPSITMDESAIIMCRAMAVDANFLIQFGTLAVDYSGYLRAADYKLGIINGNGGTFAKGVVYLPFFIDMRIDVRVEDFLGRGIQYGDTSAPGPSAGVKGQREIDRDLNFYRRDSVAISNAVNPVITFADPHDLWPSSGRRSISINLFGAPAGWNAIAGKSLDALITSATTVQILNVDSSGYGAFAGTAACYLNLPSMRISKRISGVTNANPCVVTTAIPHLLTSGETVDIAEVGGMMPDNIRGTTGIHGQFVATVLTPTTFSIPINTTNTTVYGTYNAGLGPGLVMPWVPLDQCDIGEFADNATDFDDTDCYYKHVRIGQYHNPSTCGWDGKHVTAHFYSFPETAEMLCAYYLGGDNNCIGTQHDGPFRYVYWTFGPRNASANTSTNCGYIDPHDKYGVLVRTEAGGEWQSHSERMKGRAGYQMFTDHVGPGIFACFDNLYSEVYAPLYEFGSGKRATSVVFDGTTGAIKKGLYTGANLARTPGGDAQGDWFINFIRPVPLDSYLEISVAGVPDAVATEDYGWSQRSIFARRIRTRVAGVAADVSQVSVIWRYP